MSTLSPLAISKLRSAAAPKPWAGVLAAADRGEEKLAAVVVRSQHAVQNSVDLAALLGALQAHDWNRVESVLASASAAGTHSLELEAPAAVLRIMADAGEAALKALPARPVLKALSALRAAKKLDRLHFNLNNPEALKWARNHSSQLVRGVSAETAAAIRRTIARSFSEGIPTKPLAVLLRKSIGLDSRRADAVLNLRSRILASPGGKVWAGAQSIRVPESPSEAWIETKTNAYAEKLLRQRALVIARTETMSASNEGQRQAWLQAVDKDLLFKDELREWIVTGDRRLCPQCESAAGDLAPLDKPFPNGSMGPPLHPMCRCTTGLSGKRGKKSSRDVAKDLDELLVPSVSDSKFSTGNPISSDRDRAAAVRDGFKARLRALKKEGIKVKLPSPRSLDVNFSSGRANVAAVDTGIDATAEGIRRMRDAGALSDSEEITLRFYKGRDNAYAHATHQNVFEINLNSPAWQSREQLAFAKRNDFLSGFHPTDDWDSTIVHEVGHLQHMLQNRNAAANGLETARNSFADHVASGWRSRKWDEAEKLINWASPSGYPVSMSPGLRVSVMKKIAAQVSRYAAENSAEFVAETWTGLVRGKRYSDDVMSLYRALGGPEFKGTAKKAVEKAVEKIGKTIVSKGSTFTSDGVYDVTLSSGHKTGIFYDSASQTWYENVHDGSAFSSHYSKMWAHSKEELLQSLELKYSRLPLPGAGGAVLPTPAPKPVTPTPPLPKPEKVLKPVRPIPDGEAGDEIRKIQRLRSEGKSYFAIADELGWAPVRNPKGPGAAEQRVFAIIKRFGDPLGRIAPLPL